MRKLCIILILLTLGIVGASSDAAAQFDRDLDPVIVLGSECGDFLTLATANIRVFVYSSEADAWNPIPFQVDDFYLKDGETEKDIEWEGNGILDALDEIVFMAKDLGDQAAGEFNWPDDVDAQNHSRYEVVVTDTAAGESRYAYIYYSNTLTQSDSSYVVYQPDRVLGVTYGIGHDTDDANGLPDSLAIVGNDLDILDGWRVRAHIDKIVVNADLGFGVVPFTGTDIYFSESMDDDIKLTYGFITVTVRATAFHEIDSLKIKAGPVRVLREHTLAIRFETTGLIDTSRIPILTMYYDKSVEFKPAFSFDLGDDVKELKSDYISFSSGLNQNSTNIKFYGNDFFIPGGTTQDSLVDRNPENQIFKKDLSDADWPGKHWFGFSGQESSFINNATLLTFVELNGVRIAPNRTPALYYFDYKNDEYDPNGVYGISGLRIYDWSSDYSTTFDIDARFRKFYLAQNSTRSEMQALFDRYSNPIALESLKQGYPDIIPPARIADLHITDRSDTSATISWTAVGDDSMSNGPASYYVIRYSATAPQNPDGNDWQWWEIASTVSNVPKPADPGVTEVFEVTGLDEATTYYFRINVVDDAGNASGLSNTASGNTTPVELVGFTATITNARQVLLKWTTASETNNLGFSVERKFAEADNWTEVGFVKGAGTTAEEQRYSFIDVPDQTGQWSYRLKQVDADGAFEYSEPVNVAIAAPQVFALQQNYPNPFNPTTTISFQIPQNARGEMILIIYDMLGRKVRTLVNEPVKSGYYDFKWDGYDDNGVMTASGVYLYRLRAGEFTATKKMVKMH